MRIEDSYSFPAAPEQVFAALADADALGDAIPGCERLIQFGPPAADGTTHYEARLRLHDVVYIADLTVIPEPNAHRLRITLDGRGPGGAFQGNGSLTLASAPPAEGEHPQTIGTYALDLQEPPGLSDMQLTALANGTGRLFAYAICDQLADDLRGRESTPPEGAVGGGPDDEDATPNATEERLRAQRVERLMRAETPYGEIVAVPRKSTEPFSPLWFQYTAGMLAGLAVGISILALTAATLRRLFGGGEQPDE